MLSDILQVALPLCPLKGSDGGRLVIPAEIAVDDNDAGTKNDVSMCGRSSTMVGGVSSKDGGVHVAVRVNR